ncbi:MAG: SDR family NAD(P)-dependent oxidoreductase [Acidimicrobiales bacterium]
MTGRLDGKVAIVTGATSGIGEATARLFVEEGATVVLAGRTTEKGEAVAKELGDRACFRRCDVAVEQDVADLVETAKEKFGRLDCLFSNAGAATPSSLSSVTSESLTFAMQLLVGSVLFGIKHAKPLLRESDGGSIINNSSIAAHRQGQGDLLYSAAKAAVSHITHLAAVELGPFGVRVNAISPGAILTPIFWGGSEAARQLSVEENRSKQEKMAQVLADCTPTPRSGLPGDIASAALYLASDDSSYVNGHDLVVDGGRIWAYNEPRRC